MSTCVLIPGAGGDPWEWHRLVAELVARGQEAIAVRLPTEDDTAGWFDYADAVVDACGDRAGVARREYHASLGLSAAEAEDDAVIYYHDLSPGLRAEAQARTWQDQSMTPLNETFVTIGNGDPADYERTEPAVRDAAHAHDARLRAMGAVMAIAGPMRYV